LPLLLFEKGIQVQLDLPKKESEGQERKYYQMMDEREEELIDKESKKRILHHRLSHKNSLTLLELERLNELQSKAIFKPAHSKRSNLISSGFSKKTRNESKMKH